MSNDLPTGYRWATEDEAERIDREGGLGAVLVELTVDDSGYRYRNGEADWAVPIDAGKENLDRIRAAFTADPRWLIEWAAQQVVALGAKSEWDNEDNYATTESLADLPKLYYGLPSAVDQDDDALRFYGLAAQHLGYPADIDNDTEDEEDDDDA